MSLLFATQLTAIATAALAVFAIVTAFYARQAFRKQSQEVRDQASMLKVQSEQLAAQRKINSLQAEDLRESLKERARQGKSPNANRPTRLSSA
jgi:ABC-type bacteriocin/lantibiotic exporter with double-glycine peptidase domain